MSLYLWLVLAGVALFIALVLTIRQLPNGFACCGRYGGAPPDATGKHLFEPHHGWYGAALIAVPLWPVQVVGIVLLADDLAQHRIQLRGTRPYAQSPLHHLAAVSWYKVFP